MAADEVTEQETEELAVNAEELAIAGVVSWTVTTYKRYYLAFSLALLALLLIIPVP